MQGGMRLSAKMSVPDKLQECREWSGITESSKRKVRLACQLDAKIWCAKVGVDVFVC